MPQIIINQDMASYVKYAKRKSREETLKTLAIILLGSLLILGLWYAGWTVIHIQ